MSTPFQKQFDCPYNQHQLQLAATETHKELNIHSTARNQMIAVFN